MKQNRVRIVLQVTPEEKQIMAEVAALEDYPVEMWALRAARAAARAVMGSVPATIPPATPCITP